MAANYILKPCPFCGGSAEIIRVARRANDFSLVRCCSCGIEGPSVAKAYEYSSDEVAVTRWNTRYEEGVFDDE